MLIQNCDAWVKNPADKEFDVCKIDFNAEAVSTLDTHKFPEITIRDCNFHSYAPDTYLVYFMVAGKRNCCSSYEAPSVVANNDDKGTLNWQYIDRGIDWTESFNHITSLVEGQFIRTFDTAIDNDGKTAFFNTKVFLVTKAGNIPSVTDANKPTDTSGKEFTFGTATIKYVEWHEWQANRQYSVGDGNLYTAGNASVLDALMDGVRYILPAKLSKVKIYTRRTLMPATGSALALSPAL